MLDGSLRAATGLLRGVRVLIVEDSWYIARAMESMLKDVGMVIAGAAATTTDAERLVRENAPSVAVVDVKLRDGMSFDLIERLDELGIRVVVDGLVLSWTQPLSMRSGIRGRCGRSHKQNAR